MNSLAPFNGFTASAALGAELGWVRHSLTPLCFGLQDDLRLGNLLATTQSLFNSSRFTSQHLVPRQLEQARWIFGTEPEIAAPRVWFHTRPTSDRITLFGSVAEWANQNGKDVQVIKAVAEFCLQVIPGATGVSADLDRDPEDDSVGVRFVVSTTGTVDDIIGAEETLHARLFHRVPSAHLVLFSLVYEFER